MNFKTFQKSIKEICDDNKLILRDKLSDDSYIASIMDPDDSKNNVLNLSAKDGDVNTYVVTNDGDEIEKFNKSGDYNDAEYLEFAMDSIDSFKILSGIDPDDTDDNGDPILNEDEDQENNQFSGIADGLNTIKLAQKKVADQLRELSELSDDPEVIAIVMDLSNNAYSAVLDIEAAVDSYNEIMEIPDEEDEDLDEAIEDTNAKIEESRNRIKIAESVIAMRKMSKSGLIESQDFKRFESLINEIFD